MVKMNREELQKWMPHRDPMLLIDSSEQVEDGVISRYTVPDDPYYTRGHFPGNPIVPGVILCEIMAQGSVLLFYEKLVGRLALYAGMDKVRFKHSVHPGDTVVVRSRISSTRGMFISVQAEATVNNMLCASGTLSFMLVEKQ
jgi:3-hydroxyacyl-[acyl-carrier-protein] dehydratase